MLTKEQMEIQKLQLDLARVYGIALTLAAIVAKLPGAESADIQAAIKSARQVPLPSRTADFAATAQTLEQLLQSKT